MKRPVTAFLFYSAITIALAFPLVRQLATALPNDPGDPALNTWILWWNAHAVPYTAKWWNAPAFYPAPGALAFSENLLGLSLISTPLQWLGAGPQLAYNIVFLLTFPLSALGAYLLCRELTGRDDASLIAGLLFGFAPYRIAHLPQIQCLAAFPMPFALLGLHRYLRERRSKWLVLFGAGWLLQALCNGYYMLFFAVVVALWILWFVRSPRDLGAIVTAWIVASLPLAPLLWQYRQIHEGFGFTRDFETISGFGADVGALLNAAGALRFWGWLRLYRRAEGELFPGLTITLLIVAGALLPGRDPAHAAASPRARSWKLARRILTIIAIATAVSSFAASAGRSWHVRVFGVQLLSVSDPMRSLTASIVLAIALVLTGSRVRAAFSERMVLGFYAVLAFLTWLFSLGPAPTFMGNAIMLRGPYALLMVFPGFNALRVPARFWMMTTLCLAMIGGLLFDRIGSRIGSLRRVAAVVVALGVLADGWVTAFPIARPPAVWNVESCDRGETRALVEMPVGDPFLDVAAMYRGMSHRRPVVNGYSGYFPPHYAALRFGVDLLDDDVLTQLESHGVSDVVVDTDRDGEKVWTKYVTSHAGVKMVCSEGGKTLYRFGGAQMPARQGTVGALLKIEALHANVNEGDERFMLDHDLSTRWQSGPQSPTTTIDIDLGSEHDVTALQMALGSSMADFPRSFSVEVLGADARWKEIFKGGTAGRAFVGAFESPKEVPLTFDFSGVRARYLRLRSLAADPIYYWSIAELRVFGK